MPVDRFETVDETLDQILHQVCPTCACTMDMTNISCDMCAKAHRVSVYTCPSCGVAKIHPSTCTMNFYIDIYQHDHKKSVKNRNLFKFLGEDGYLSQYRSMFHVPNGTSAIRIMAKKSSDKKLVATPGYLVESHTKHAIIKQAKRNLLVNPWYHLVDDENIHKTFAKCTCKKIGEIALLECQCNKILDVALIETNKLRKPT
ncbi:hypothetical protein SNEBB_010393 [Seison nebaliae]|nr:hypothetical protein SNEBB_010393 [Seison nebaliae]